MAQFKCGEHSIELDPSSPPKGNAFHQLVSKLKRTHPSVDDLSKIIHLYRNDEQSSMALLDCLSNYNADPLSLTQNDIECLIIRIAIYIQYGRDVTDLFNHLRYTKDRRIDFLKGMFLLQAGEFEDAEFLFGKVGYKTGIEIAYLKSNRMMAATSNDYRIKCYSDSNNWNKSTFKDVDMDKLPKDFLYRIGLSNSFDNSANIDVILRNITDGINSNRITLKGARLELEKLLDKSTESAELFYLIGKTYHMEERTKEACKYYEKAIGVDPNYEPASWNLTRILNKVETITDSNIKSNESLNDYRTLQKLMRKEINVSGDGCSEEIKKIIYVCKYLMGNDANKFERLIKVAENEEFKGIFDKEVIYNNCAILIAAQNKRKAEQILRKGLKISNEKYTSILQYNLGILLGDCEILRDVPFPEAAQHIEILERVSSSGNQLIMRYLCINGEMNAENETCLKDGLALKDANVKLFSALALGAYYIQQYFKTKERNLLELAEKIYRGFTGSFMAVNGIGVIYALRGEIDSALKIFRQVAGEFTGAYFNIAKCYLMMKEWRSAVEVLTRYLSLEEDKEAKSIIMKIFKSVRGLEDLKRDFEERNSGMCDAERHDSECSNKGRKRRQLG